MRDPKSGKELPHYRYEPDEQPKKKKHHWGNEWAGFVRVSGIPVAKCPNGMSTQLAEELLNNGLPWFNPNCSGPHPDRIYVVHQGVVYRAMPTVSGVSYHAFPERPAELRQWTKTRKTQLIAHAQAEQDAVKAWIANEEVEEAP